MRKKTTLKRMLDFIIKVLTLNAMAIMMLLYCLLIVWILYKVEQTFSVDSKKGFLQHYIYEKE